MPDWSLKMSRQNIAYRGARKVGSIDRPNFDMWIARVDGPPVRASTFKLRREAVAWIEQQTEPAS